MHSCFRQHPSTINSFCFYRHQREFAWVWGLFTDTFPAGVNIRFASCGTKPWYWMLICNHMARLFLFGRLSNHNLFIDTSHWLRHQHWRQNDIKSVSYFISLKLVFTFLLIFIISALISLDCRSFVWSLFFIIIGLHIIPVPVFN